MATFLDIGLVSHFQSVFTVLLVFAIIFAVLEKSKLLGENRGLHSIISLSIAMMMLFIPGVGKVVGVMAPWFILMFLAIIFFLFLLLAFGTKTDAIVEEASHWGLVHWFLLVIGIIIIIGSIGTVYGDSLLPYTDADGQNPNTAVSDTGLENPTDTGDFNNNVGRVIFHPKTIGLVLIFMIASLTIKLITGPPKLS